MSDGPDTKEECEVTPDGGGTGSPMYPVEETPPDQVVDRYKNRRRMAWISFYFICLFGSGLIIYGLSSEEISTRLDKLSFMIGTVFGVWGGIVLAYFGASAYTDTRGLK